VPQPVVGILTDDAKSYSRPRFTEEAAALRYRRFRLGM